MRAHLLDANGVIRNTVEVDSLDVFPNLVDAVIGGTAGDAIVNGVLVRSPNNTAQQSFSVQRALYLEEVRVMREPLLERLNNYGTQLLLGEPPILAEEKLLCKYMIDGLLNITSMEVVVNASSVDEIKLAVKAEYARLVGLASPAMETALRKVDK